MPMPQTMTQTPNWRWLALTAAAGGALAAGLAGLAMADGLVAFWHGFVYNGFSALPAGLFIC